jgi:hypothetical protein
MALLTRNRRLLSAIGWGVPDSGDSGDPRIQHAASQPPAQRCRTLERHSTGSAARRVGLLSRRAGPAYAPGQPSLFVHVSAITWEPAA